MTDKYIILKDTREKNGWDFNAFDKCRAVVNWGLKTGDYVARGLEKHLVRNFFLQLSQKHVQL